MRIIYFIAFMAMYVASHAADLTHTYTFDAGLGDTTGVVDLEANGGSIHSGRYHFGSNQGLTLRDGLTDPASYTIEMSVQFEPLLGLFFKLIDFAELSQDDGLYIFDDNLIFYPQTNDSYISVLPNTDYVFVLSREASGISKGYINGNIVFTIGADNAVAATNVLEFFTDDLITGQRETSSGSIDYLRIYDGALTDAEVAALTPAVPQIVGDTIVGVLGFNNVNLNAWNPIVTGGPVSMIVVEPGLEFFDVANTDALEFRADIEQNRLTYQLEYINGLQGSTGTWQPTISDMDFETPIVDVVVIENSFVNGVNSISFTDDSVSVDLIGGAQPAGEIFELVLEIVTATVTDSDTDGVADEQDNCTLAANPSQHDSNGDGYGNACDADINNDCVINVVDLGMLRAAFFAAPGEANWNPDADLNGDDVVNVVDLGRLRTQFFGQPGPSAVGDVCEPQ